MTQDVKFGILKINYASNALIVGLCIKINAFLSMISVRIGKKRGNVLNAIEGIIYRMANA